MATEDFMTLCQTGWLQKGQRAEDGDREALSCRKTCNPGGSQDQVSSHPERTILTPPASLQHPIPEAQPGRILQVDETGAAPEATQLGKVAGIQAQSGSQVLAPALLLLKYGHYPGLGATCNIPQEKG